MALKVIENKQQAAQSVQRKKELTCIHALKNELRMDDDTYRLMLNNLVGKNSAGLCNSFERQKIIMHLKSKVGAVQYGTKPHNLDSNPQLQKIEALLTVQKKPWGYAEAMAKRMYKKSALAFCAPEELQGIITALIVGGKRKRKAAGRS
jgi:phage gp16-like protein